MFREIYRSFCSFPKLPKTEFKPQPYVGFELNKLIEIRKSNISPALYTIYKKPLVLHQGYKQWLYDIENKRYLDMFGGICTVSVGHSHPKITKAVTEQIKRLSHVSNIYMHPKIHEYAEKLTKRFSGNLKVVYFVNSGSEANDLAVLMARCYTNKSEIITINNGYHGMSNQTMALNSTTVFKYPINQAYGVHSVMNPDVFKGIWGGNRCRDSPVQTSRICDCLTNCKANVKYIEEFNNIFKYRVNKNNLAAFFAESIQGIGGTVQYPKGYLKAIWKCVKRNDGLYVADEVQTGFGRTGEHFWGFEMHNIQPDIVTMAKGIGNGFPLGAVITTPEISNALLKSTHFNTFGGNPLACTVGMTVLDIIEEEQLQHNCANVGTYLLKELEKLKTKHKNIGDVRGKGLMIGIELVREDGSIEPIASEKFLDVMETCRSCGLLVGRGGIDGNTIRIKPPMCITHADADFTIQVLAEALERIEIK